MNKSVGTYSQIYLQFVFAVKNRDCLITSDIETRIYEYISGIVSEKGQKLIAINGMPNHIHIFIGLKPGCNISDLVREIKKASTNFINENQLTQHVFAWQKGYAVFSYGHSQIDVVVKYILNQKIHHKKYSFKAEYESFLKKFNIEFEDKYLFDWID